MDYAAAETHLARARVHYARGDTKAARRELDAGLAAVAGRTVPARTSLLVLHARMVAWDWDPPSALATARAAYESAIATGTELAGAHAALAWALFFDNDSSCLDAWRKARRIARAEGDLDVYLDAAFCALAAREGLGEGRRTIRLAEVLERMAEQMGKRIWADLCSWHVVRAAMLAKGSPGAAADELRRLLAAPGLGLSRVHTGADLALALGDSGAVAEARRLMASLVPLAATPYDQGVIAFYRAEVEWAGGRAEHALRAAEEGLPHVLGPTATGLRSLRLWALFELGRPEADPALHRPALAIVAFGEPVSRAFGAVAAGDLAAAERHLHDAADRMAGVVVREELRALWGAGAIALQRGATKRARTLLVEVDERATETGYVALLPRVRQLLREFDRPRRKAPPATLTPRERLVLTEVAAGRTSAEIAEHLGIGRSTVETHIRSAMTKLDARTRTHAVRLAGLGRRDVELAPQDAELVALLDDGATIGEAAERLGISRSTATRRLRALRGR